MHSRGKALVLATFAVAAVLLWESRGDGPDFGHYFEWGRAAVSGNIFELDGDILAVGGVPFSQWSAAPGMLFATTYYAAGERIELRTAAYLTGWAAAMLFWVSAFTALRPAGPRPADDFLRLPPREELHPPVDIRTDPGAAT